MATRPLGRRFCFICSGPSNWWKGRTTSMWFGSTFPDAPKIYLSSADLQQQWSGPGRIFLFVPPHLKEKVDGILPRKFVIAQASGKVVYSNRVGGN